MAQIESPPAAPGVKPLGLRGDLSALKIDRGRRRRTPIAALALWFLLGAGVVSAAAAGGYWAFKDRLFPVPIVKVESVRVMTLGQAQTKLTATGYLESRWQAAVGAKVPGRIANIPVEEGSRVNVGDVLAELEHADLDAVLASRKVAVSLAEAQLAEADFNLEQSKRDLIREQNVFNQKAGTTAALERAQTNENAAQAIRRARAAAVAAAKSAVVEAEQAINNMFIYAPFDGTVLTKDAEKGESIMPGGMGASSGRGSVITMANLDQLEVDTDVKEDYLGQLHKGQPTQVAVDAVPDRRYQGSLREIIRMGDRTRGIVKVKVSILDPDERLFPDLSATVHFLPDSSGDSGKQALQKGVFAPVAAIQGNGDSQYAWVLEADHVCKTPVKASGEPHDGLVAISSGLSGGERLVVTPPPDLKDGEQVKTAE
jgi:RND family efflux transporter MFP subunit